MNEKKNLREENEIVLTNSKMSQVLVPFSPKQSRKLIIRR